MGIADLLGGAAEGILQADREDRANRLQNMQVWQSYVRFNAELGLAPNPAEMSRVAEQISGGDNYLRRQLPARETMGALATTLRTRADNMRSAAEMQRTQQQLQIEQMFGPRMDEQLANDASPEDARRAMATSLQNQPQLLSAFEAWVQGQNLEQRRQRLYTDRANALLQTIRPEETEQDIRTRFQGQPDAIMQQLISRGRSNDVTQRRARTDRAIEHIRANPALYGQFGNDPAALQRQLTTIFGGDVDMERVQAFGQSFATTAQAEQQRAAVTELLNDRMLDGVIGNNFNIDAVRTEIDTALRGRGMQLTPQIEQMIRDRAMARRVSQLEGQYVTQSNQARTEAGRAWDEEATRAREATERTLAQRNANDRRSPAISQMLANQYYIAPAQAQRVGEIAAEVLRAAESDAPIATIVNQIAQRASLPTYDRARDAYISRRLSDLGLVRPQLFSTYEATHGTGFQRFQSEIMRGLGEASTQTTHGLAQADALRRIDAALTQMRREFDGRHNLVGFDEARAQAMRQQLLDLRSRVAGAQPDANLPRAPVNPAQVAMRVQPDGQLVNHMLGAESGYNWNARNRQSSAAGAGQFLDGTWLEMIYDHGAQFGVDRGLIERARSGDRDARQQILDMRLGQHNEALVRNMTAMYASRNLNELERAGLRNLTETDAYVAHFLGSGGAIRFLRAYREDPTREGYRFVGDGSQLSNVVSANERIFYQVDRGGERMRARTLGEIYDMLTTRLNAGGRNMPTPQTSAPPTPSSSGPGYSYGGRVYPLPVTPGGPTLLDNARGLADAVVESGRQHREGVAAAGGPPIATPAPEQANPGSLFADIGRAWDGITSMVDSALTRPPAPPAGEPAPPPRDNPPPAASPAAQRARVFDTIVRRINELPPAERERFILSTAASSSEPDRAQLFEVLIARGYLSRGQAMTYMARLRRGRPTD